jgi:hypothetical protein
VRQDRTVVKVTRSGIAGARRMLGRMVGPF